MSHIVSRRQIRAARMLAGLTQRILPVRRDIIPDRSDIRRARVITCQQMFISTLDSIERALVGYGVVPFSTLTPGVRLL